MNKSPLKGTLNEADLRRRGGTGYLVEGGWKIRKRQAAFGQRTNRMSLSLFRPHTGLEERRKTREVRKDLLRGKREGHHKVA